jgi:CheY-like chemotaxis protein
MFRGAQVDSAGVGGLLARLAYNRKSTLAGGDLGPMTTSRTSKPRILVVDDERRIADTLVIILNQSGFDASAVYTGSDAVDRARASQPDLVITDVIMPDMNGIDAAIQIREFLPACKILLFSGQAATADLLEKARAEGHEFEILAKPVHPQDLLSKLRG